MPAHHPMWEKHRGLVWSNPEAGDTVHLRAALLNPRFDCFLGAAVVIGIDRLKEEWRVLHEEDRPEARRARPIVERILKHIARGFELDCRTRLSLAGSSLGEFEARKMRTS